MQMCLNCLQVFPLHSDSDEQMSLPPPSDFCYPPAFFPLQALSYAGGFGKVLVPHVVEREIVQADGSVVKRLESCTL